MIRIGVRAHDFGRLPAGTLAATIAATKVDCVQLALSKALPEKPYTPQDADASAITTAFEQQGLTIAVIGCYINPVHPDQTTREQELQRFEAHLMAAPLFHCSIVGTETGSCAPDCSYHPETASEKTFIQLVCSIERLVKIAERIGSVIVGVEAVAEKHTISTAQQMARLLKEIDSPAIGVVFDPTNLVPRTGVVSQQAFLDECFDAFGTRIVAIHAKDYRIIEGCCGPVKSPSLPAGTGELDWAGIFHRLKMLRKDSIPILMEDIQPTDVPATLERLVHLWQQA